MADIPQIIEAAGMTVRVRYGCGHEILSARDQVPAACPTCAPPPAPKK